MKNNKNSNITSANICPKIIDKAFKAALSVGDISINKEKLNIQKQICSYKELKHHKTIYKTKQFTNTIE